ncbi:hypothetical protein CRG98_041766 [Punica granatum]|uniref:Uncharacterized protein n=1 Tax=Punica granatum TaxID=22663 RepID=A0A2I0I2Z8_PUNGR|nr:hypothetical protein CRG98_041766 [Punica granatum]
MPPRWADSAGGISDFWHIPSPSTENGLRGAVPGTRKSRLGQYHLSYRRAAPASRRLRGHFGHFVGPSLSAKSRR